MLWLISVFFLTDGAYVRFDYFCYYYFFATDGLHITLHFVTLLVVLIFC